METTRSPKRRLRFGFSGKRKPSNIEEPTKITTDDLLDSLTRQASSQVGFGEDQQKGFEVLVDEDDPQPSFEQSEMPVAPFKVTTGRSFGKFAFVLMFLGGVLAVWLSGSGSRLLDPSSLGRLVQSSAVHTVFANPAEVGIISLFALTLAIWVAHRRKSSRPQISL